MPQGSEGDPECMSIIVTFCDTTAGIGNLEVWWVAAEVRTDKYECWNSYVDSGFHIPPWHQNIPLQELKERIYFTCYLIQKVTIVLWLRYIEISDLQDSGNCYVLLASFIKVYVSILVSRPKSMGSV